MCTITHKSLSSIQRSFPRFIFNRFTALGVRLLLPLEAQFSICDRSLYSFGAIDQSTTISSTQVHLRKSHDRHCSTLLSRDLVVILYRDLLNFDWKMVPRRSPRSIKMAVVAAKALNCDSHPYRVLIAFTV